LSTVWWIWGYSSRFSRNDAANSLKEDWANPIRRNGRPKVPSSEVADGSQLNGFRRWQLLFWVSVSKRLWLNHLRQRSPRETRIRSISRSARISLVDSAMNRNAIRKSDLGPCPATRNWKANPQKWMPGSYKNSKSSANFQSLCELICFILRFYYATTVEI
jgi:hypothetical protein